MVRLIETLTREQFSAVGALFDDDGGFCERVHGRPPRSDDASVLFDRLPPGVSRSDKHDLGLIDDGRLVGLLDLVHGYPDPNHAYIGLLQVADSARRCGIGRMLHEAAVECARSWQEVTTMRLSIVETNRATAEPFWLALGYEPTGEQRPWIRADGFETTSSLWELALRSVA